LAQKERGTVWPTHSMKVWRWKVGHAKRQWTQLLLPLRSVTGATPTYFCREAASGNRSRRFTEGNEQARSEGGTGAGESVKELVVREVGGERCYLCIEASDSGVDGTELRYGGLDEQQQRTDDGRVGGQRLFGLNGIEAPSDGTLAPHVVASEEADEGLLSSAFGGLECRPALEKRGKDGSVFVAKPAENLRKVAFQGAGESVGDGDASIAERSSQLDHSPEAAHVGTFGLQARELLGVPKQQLERELGVSGVVLCTTRGEGPPILGEHGGLNGEEHEDVVLEERGDDGALSELQGDGDGGATEPVAKLLSPLPDGDGAMLADRASRFFCPGTCRQTSCFLSAQSMPMKAANGRATWLMRNTFVRLTSGTCRARPSEVDMVSR